MNEVRKKLTEIHKGIFEFSIMLMYLDSFASVAATEIPTTGDLAMTTTEEVAVTETAVVAAVVTRIDVVAEIGTETGTDRGIGTGEEIEIDIVTEIAAETGIAAEVETETVVVVIRTAIDPLGLVKLSALSFPL